MDSPVTLAEAGAENDRISPLIDRSQVKAEVKVNGDKGKN